MLDCFTANGKAARPISTSPPRWPQKASWTQTGDTERGSAACSSSPVESCRVSAQAGGVDEPKPVPVTSVLDRDVALAVRLADWLDDRYLDPVIGLLLPGFGDLAMTVVGLYPVMVALRRRMPGILVARMLKNLAVDLICGAVPILGDAFDFVFKVHRKNAELLLERYLLGPSNARDWAVVLAAALALLVAIAVPFALLAFVISKLG
jgi:hypothetical protein